MDIMILVYTILAIIIGGGIAAIRVFGFHKKLNGLAIAKAVAQDVVKAIEQLSTNKPMTSDEKKQMAVQMLTTMLEAQGITLAPAIIDAIIEAAVWTMNFFIKGHQTQKKPQ
jgi:hypothetical protein